MKTWCRHIKWQRIEEWDKAQWITKLGAGFNGQNATWYEVPRSWKVCPICLAKRPTRKNIKAAKLQAEMDSDYSPLDGKGC